MPYLYCHNNPVNLLDPTGLKAFPSVKCTPSCIPHAIPPGVGAGAIDHEHCSYFTTPGRCCSFMQSLIARDCCRETLGKKLSTCSRVSKRGDSFIYNCSDDDDCFYYYGCCVDTVHNQCGDCLSICKREDAWPFWKCPLKGKNLSKLCPELRNRK